MSPIIQYRSPLIFGIRLAPPAGAGACAPWQGPRGRRKTPNNRLILAHPCDVSLLKALALFHIAQSLRRRPVVRLIHHQRRTSARGAGQTQYPKVGSGIPASARTRIGGLGDREKALDLTGGDCYIPCCHPSANSFAHCATGASGSGRPWLGSLWATAETAGRQPAGCPREQWRMVVRASA